MLDITTSLDEVATAYWIFERDQVLTEEQLNSLARYLDDQDRLTRVGEPRDPKAPHQAAELGGLEDRPVTTAPGGGSPSPLPGCGR